MSVDGKQKRSATGRRPDAHADGAAPSRALRSGDPADGRARRRLVAGIITAIVAVIVLVHWPVLSSKALSFDDAQFVTDNPLVQNPSWNSVARFFGEVLHPSMVEGYYLPLSMTSLMLDWAWGGRPDYLFPFHATSLLLHVANALLVFWLIYRLWGRPWSAAAAAILFGLHPLTVEPVAWVGERKTVLAAFFALLAILAYARYVRQGGWGARWGSVGLYILAVLSKPTAWPLWLGLVVLDYWPFARLSWKAALEKWPFLIVAAVSAVITLLSHQETAGLRAGGSLLQVPVQAAYLLSFYLAKIFWPAHLTSIYVLPSPMSVTNPAVLLGLAGTVAVGVLLGLSLKRTRSWLAGALFFLIMLAPTLGVVHYSWVQASDKYLYLPLIGLLLPFASLVGRWLDKPDARTSNVVPVLGLLLVIAAAEAWATRTYLREWQTTERLARHMVRLAPDSGPAHSVLASALLTSGKTEEAMAVFARLMQVDPNYADGRYNYASALAQAGNIDAAIAEYLEAVRLAPGSVKAHNNLANLLARRGRYDEARVHYARVLQLRPGSPEPHYNLGNTYLATRESDKAVHHFREAMRYAPNRPQVHLKLGMALEQAGQFQAAAASYQQALRLNPRYQQAHDALRAVQSGARTTSQPGER